MVKVDRKRRLRANTGSGKLNMSYEAIYKKNKGELQYYQLLQTKEWRNKRDEIMLERDFECECCGVYSPSNHLHHMYYIPGRLPWEYPHSAFKVLCKEHHEQEHN